MAGVAHQQDRDPVELLIGLLRAPRPMIADLAIPKPSQEDIPV
jgi:hypothetical protein